ncbi:MAG TPA: MBL fold metallo-hydrolase [Candidatus Krumholzibacteria bacterium]|nr:MBL fold metallo-hydrolase [Candidatus Krumholzibacteria bacterium]HPD71864.1 MBL fold metallo-hydrolase [Candidatus Krumholzibacteria bacterium]HRY41203.1 MBL fold metallo-hydrolase [Candidatus Krumholzibacteria bacterium]
MRVYFAGTRGSAPATQPDRAVFGGDTTCLLVTGLRGAQVVLDCGSGLPAIAPRLAPAAELVLLLTHFHVDHLIGLATFGPLYASGSRLRFAAPRAGGATVEAALRGLLRAPYWPVELDRVPARLSFADLPPSSGAEPLRIGDLEVRWAPVPHPDGCTAYRLDDRADGTSLVLATDAEWRDAPAELRLGFLTLCREPSPCDLLICDGQYDDTTAAARHGWGHSSQSQAVELARESGARRLLLTHHDPEAVDATLAARERALRAVLSGAAFARQGDEIDLARKDAR